MKKKLSEKMKNLNTKNKLILSLGALFTSILGGISIAIILKSIVSIFIMLGVAFSLDFLLDNYIDYKKMYCYELADEYFNKIKDNIEEKQVKLALKKKVKQNKLCNAIFIGSIPLSFLLTLILFAFNITLLNALTWTGVICFSSVIVTMPWMGYTSFGIDVLCEVIEKIENNKISTELAKINQQNTTFKEEIEKLTYNTGISQYRYKHIPGGAKSDFIEIIVPDKSCGQKNIKVREKNNNVNKLLKTYLKYK